MSVQSEIETALAGSISALISGMVVTAGPITTPRAEGSGRVGSVRKVSSSGTRLEFAQIAWADAYVVTLYWHAATITRATSATEWEVWLENLTNNPQLGLVESTPTVEEIYVSSMQWGEAFEGHFRTMTATVTVSRVE